MLVLSNFVVSIFRDGGVSKPVPTAPSSSFSSGSQVNSSIVVEKRDEVVAPNVSGPMNLNTASTTTAPTIALKRKDQSSQKVNHVSPTKKTKVLEKSGSAVLFPPLKPCSPLFQQAGHYSVSITNNQNLYHLQVFRGTSVEPLWENYLGYSATALATSPSIIAVSLEDGSVHTFHTTKGSRATPPLAPPSPISKLHAAGSMVKILFLY